jgi:hypothetical protein
MVDGEPTWHLANVRRSPNGGVTDPFCSLWASIGLTGRISAPSLTHWSALCRIPVCARLYRVSEAPSCYKMCSYYRRAE